MIRYPPSTKLAVIVLQDDITNAQSEAVVTGEGEWFTSDSAVTKSLETVLPQLKRIRSKMRDDGGLDLWTARVSPLGPGYRFQYVIHAVLDKGNNDQWLRFMKTLYKNIFIEADRNKISSIALPLLGTGASASDTRLSIEALVTSIRSYSPSYLTLVKVVTYNQDLLDKVKATFRHEESRGYESSTGILENVLTGLKDLFLPLSYYDKNKDENNSCRYEQATSTTKAHGGHKSYSPAPHRDYKDHQSQLSVANNHAKFANSSGRKDGRGSESRQRGHGSVCSKEYCQIQRALQVSREEASVTRWKQENEHHLQKTIQQSDEYSNRNRKQQETERQSQEALQQHSENDVAIRVHEDNISMTALQFEGQIASGDTCHQVNMKLIKHMEGNPYLKLAAERRPRPHSPNADTAVDKTSESTSVNDIKLCIGEEDSHLKDLSRDTNVESSTNQETDVNKANEKEHDAQENTRSELNDPEKDFSTGDSSDCKHFEGKGTDPQENRKSEMDDHERDLPTGDSSDCKHVVGNRTEAQENTRSELDDPEKDLSTDDSSDSKHFEGKGTDPQENTRSEMDDHETNLSTGDSSDCKHVVGNRTEAQENTRSELDDHGKDLSAGDNSDSKHLESKGEGTDAREITRSELDDHERDLSTGNNSEDKHVEGNETELQEHTRSKLDDHERDLSTCNSSDVTHLEGKGTDAQENTIRELDDHERDLTTGDSSDVTHLESKGTDAQESTSSKLDNHDRDLSTCDNLDCKHLEGKGTDATSHDLKKCDAPENSVDCLRSTEDNNKTGDSQTDSIRTCPICLSAIRKSKKLDKCGHVFCQDCIDQSFRDFKPVCPSCNMVYGIITGNQPEGNMDVGFSSQSLPDYEHHGTITITYSFPSGIQKEGHPYPGKPYKGTTRRAYLPDCKEGRDILFLLRTAFDRKLTFTVGRSTTTGQENVVTWNDIHHKTNMGGGPTRFGYPDPTYLARVRDELVSKGVTTQ